MKRNLLPSLTLDFLRQRESVKSFEDIKDSFISIREKNTIIEAANLAPTSFNLQPFRIFWLDEEDLKLHNRSFVYGNQQKNAKGCAVICSFENFDQYSWETTVRKMSKSVIDENHITSTCQSEVINNEWAANQSYIPSALMTIAAMEHGIDSCIMEGFKESVLISQLIDIFGNAFELPTYVDSLKIQYVIMFGYNEQTESSPKLREQLEIIRG